MFPCEYFDVICSVLISDIDVVIDIVPSTKLYFPEYFIRK